MRPFLYFKFSNTGKSFKKKTIFVLNIILFFYSHFFCFLKSDSKKCDGRKPMQTKITHLKS